MGQTLSAFWDQTFLIPEPGFRERDLCDQTGKVHIITGGYAGIGLELAKLLYQRNATLYLAGRSPSKAASAIASLTSPSTASKGRVEFLHLDLADLSSIKSSVDKFFMKEKRLDVLVNNAGIMVPPAGMKSKQGWDLQLATNVYGPWLFTYFLLPILIRTARNAETGTVRVVWAASFGAELAPRGGVVFDGKEGISVEGMKVEEVYCSTKAANILLGVETARRYSDRGIVSNSFNPGNLASELDRYSSWWQVLLMNMLRYPARMGAYTELFAGWSSEITPEKNGCYIIPWGRIGGYNTSLQKAVNRAEDGGEGRAEKLWEACEKVCKEFI
ncbi:NAD(P)-binding protein [Lojkania enalia]|uniref:NAD(P)-binding protein n=1 Tax=Lojkania enalia TaxID=147567 RepID=A0A9P4KE43_9PLEO|nr:NAD(P)-binding protein [Didymosphaeria enalia]